MSDIRYIISDASNRIDVEPHTLRYWEEELDVPIPRNEMGHRYYTEYHIELFKTVKVLKEQGFQLKAIKMLLPDLDKIETLDPQSILKLREEVNGMAESLEKEEKDNNKSLVLQKEGQATPVNHNKMGQFREIMSDIVLDAMRENNKELSNTVSDNVIKQMDYLLRLKEEKEEERFRKFDESIREMQKMRQETAVAKEKKQKKAKPSKFRQKNQGLFRV